MPKTLLLVLCAILLIGCSSLRRPPDVAEIPDELWERAKKEAAEKSQSANSKTLKPEDLEKLNRAVDKLGWKPKSRP
jgi:hypothetical protein